MKLEKPVNLKPGDIIITKNVFAYQAPIRVVGSITDEGIKDSYLNDCIIPQADAFKVVGLADNVVAWLHRRHCYPSFEAVGRAAWESPTDSAKAVKTTLATVKKKLTAIRIMVAATRDLTKTTTP